MTTFSSSSSSSQTGNDSKDFIFLGIGGISRSGKSTLSHAIKDFINAQQDCYIEIIHQDDFVKEENLIPTIQNHIDWEHPDSIDWVKLHSEIEIRRSKLDNYSNSKLKVLILEGLLAFYDEKLNLMFDEKILVQIDEELFYQRKSTDDRWGIEPRWYQEHIYRSFLKYGMPNDLEHFKVVRGDENVSVEKLEIFTL